ncbi:MAG: hypothetical protein WAZ11_01565, partial [Trichococcus flocculiformis]
LYACVVYILSEPIGFRMGLQTATYLVGLVATVAIMALYWTTGVKQKVALSPESELLNDHLPIGTFSSIDAVPAAVAAE